jgi:hypothetical protein
VGDPQFFAEKRNPILLQPGKIVKKRRLNAAASAFCEACVNYDPLCHVWGVKRDARRRQTQRSM